MVDLDLPAGTQDQVLEAIRRGLEDPSAIQQTVVGDEDETDEDGEEGEMIEDTRDPKEIFWDEVFDSLFLTVPFTFLYLLLDM